MNYTKILLALLFFASVLSCQKYDDSGGSKHNNVVALTSNSIIKSTKGSTAWMLSPWPEFIRVLPTVSYTIAYKIYKK